MNLVLLETEGPIIKVPMLKFPFFLSFLLTSPIFFIINFFHIAEYHFLMKQSSHFSLIFIYNLSVSKLFYNSSQEIKSF